jgi:hypothetical protein
MKILAAVLAIFAMSGCATFGPLKYQDNVVSLPARIIDIKQAQRAATSPTLLGGTNYRSYTGRIYVLKIANRENVEVDDNSSFEVGQCVTLYVKAGNVGDTRFFPATSHFPATGEIERADKCPG